MTKVLVPAAGSGVIPDDGEAYRSAEAFYDQREKSRQAGDAPPERSGSVLHAAKHSKRRTLGELESVVEDEIAGGRPRSRAVRRRKRKSKS